jgi:hypothetical protein
MPAVLSVLRGASHPALQRTNVLLGDRVNAQRLRRSTGPRIS